MFCQLERIAFEMRDQTLTGKASGLFNMIWSPFIPDSSQDFCVTHSVLLA